MKALTPERKVLDSMTDALHRATPASIQYTINDEQLTANGARELGDELFKRVTAKTRSGNGLDYSSRSAATDEEIQTINAYWAEILADQSIDIDPE